MKAWTKNKKHVVRTTETDVMQGKCDDLILAQRMMAKRCKMSHPLPSRQMAPSLCM